MGSAKGRRENKAEDIAGKAAETERQQAGQLQTELQQRKDIAGMYLPEAQTGAFQTAQNFAQTGGFAPGEQEAFLRRSTLPVISNYSRAKDELERQKSLQGGYMPGYTASVGRLTRQAGSAAAEAGLGANVELAKQVREGRQFGQTALQRYASQGLSGLSDIDITQLRNRYQSGQMSMDDAKLLAAIASQDKDTFDKITSISKAVAGVGAVFV